MREIQPGDRVRAKEGTDASFKKIGALFPGNPDRHIRSGDVIIVKTVAVEGDKLYYDIKLNAGDTWMWVYIKDFDLLTNCVVLLENSEVALLRHPVEPRQCRPGDKITSFSRHGKEILWRDYLGVIQFLPASSCEETYVEDIEQKSA